MYTLDEINARLDYLESISPAGGKPLVEDLRSAIQAYFTRNSDFELQVHKTLDKVVADTFHNHLEYEYNELLERWLDNPSSGAPQGYGDVTKIFKGAEVFEEIITITDAVFKSAFYTETVSSGSGSSGSVTVEWHHRRIEDWIPRLTVAVTTELEGLKKIMQYCANRSYNVEWAILFEELGASTKRHPVRYYAKEIFLTKGYGWLIETFNLNIYRPSYMPELSDWEELEE